MNALDSLAFNCIFPKIIPEGFTDQGYTVSAMLYPVLNVLMMLLAALLMDSIGAGRILLIQCGLSVLAALSESMISVKESRRFSEDTQGIKLWLRDLKEGFCYLKGEKGLLAIRTYDAIANGMGSGYGPIMVAFFRTARGVHPGMYAIFSGAEFIGRTLPLMLLNRSICGFRDQQRHCPGKLCSEVYPGGISGQNQCVFRSCDLRHRMRVVTADGRPWRSDGL